MLTRAQLVTITVMRVLIGWHFLYEGVSKLTTEGWSAQGFLLQARGPFAGLYRWMASNPDVLSSVNQLNMWGLTLVGLGLMLGCFTRLASAAAISEPINAPPMTTNFSPFSLRARRR